MFSTVFFGVFFCRCILCVPRLWNYGPTWVFSIWCCFCSELVFLTPFLNYAALHLACLLTHSAHSHHLLFSPPYLLVPVFSLQHPSLLSLPQCLAISAYLISRYLDKYRYICTCPSPLLPLRRLFYFFFSPKGFSFLCSFSCFKWWCAVGNFVHAPMTQHSCFLRMVSSHMLVWTGLGEHGEAEDWEIRLVLTKSREYQMLFTDQDIGRALDHERWVSWWCFFAALESLEKRLPWPAFKNSFLYGLLYLERVGAISPYQRQLLL